MKDVYKCTAFQSNQGFNDSNFFTISSTEQKRVEDIVKEKYNSFLNDFLEDVDHENEHLPVLYRNAHAKYLRSRLEGITPSHVHLDASRPWMCYWAIHGLRVLEANISENLMSSVIRFLKTCEWKDGGYGGGPGQYPHLATTYAAVMALVSIGTEEALVSINREKLYNFVLSLKQPNGSFKVHEDGEIDIRASFCVLSVASILNVLDEKIAENAGNWMISCQTYEGGFGGNRCCEAHGGYTFCGVASLIILDKASLIYTPSLFKWLSQKQMKYEGGFQGRTNKLVDVCYSFWQASVFPMIEFALKSQFPHLNGSFDAWALQEYILIACQDHSGGFRDKPDKKTDLYHTCYALSGLSIAQYYTPKNIVGGAKNSLARVSPVYNVCEEYEEIARKYFINASTT